MFVEIVVGDVTSVLIHGVPYVREPQFVEDALCHLPTQNRDVNHFLEIGYSHDYLMALPTNPVNQKKNTSDTTDAVSLGHGLVFSFLLASFISSFSKGILSSLIIPSATSAFLSEKQQRTNWKLTKES